MKQGFSQNRESVQTQKNRRIDTLLFCIRGKELSR